MVAGDTGYCWQRCELYSEAIALTRCAQRGGADACLLVTPYYNKPTQEGLYLHHKKNC